MLAIPGEIWFLILQDLPPYIFMAVTELLSKQIFYALRSESYAKYVNKYWIKQCEDFKIFDQQLNKRVSVGLNSESKLMIGINKKFYFETLNGRYRKFFQNNVSNIGNISLKEALLKNEISKKSLASLSDLYLIYEKVNDSREFLKNGMQRYSRYYGQDEIVTLKSSLKDLGLLKEGENLPLENNIIQLNEKYYQLYNKVLRLLLFTDSYRLFKEKIIDSCLTLFNMHEDELYILEKILFMIPKIAASDLALLIKKKSLLRKMQENGVVHIADILTKFPKYTFATLIKFTANQLQEIKECLLSKNESCFQGILTPDFLAKNINKRTINNLQTLRSTSNLEAYLEYMSIQMLLTKKICIVKRLLTDDRCLKALQSGILVVDKEKGDAHFANETKSIFGFLIFDLNQKLDKELGVVTNTQQQTNQINPTNQAIFVSSQPVISVPINQAYYNQQPMMMDNQRIMLPNNDNLNKVPMRNDYPQGYHNQQVTVINQCTQQINVYNMNVFANAWNMNPQFYHNTGQVIVNSQRIQANTQNLQNIPNSGMLNQQIVPPNNQHMLPINTHNMQNVPRSNNIPPGYGNQQAMLFASRRMIHNNMNMRNNVSHPMNDGYGVNSFKKFE